MQTTEDAEVKFPVITQDGSVKNLSLTGSLLRKKAPRCLLATPAKVYIDQDEKKDSWAVFTQGDQEVKVPLKIKNKKPVVEVYAMKADTTQDQKNDSLMNEHCRRGHPGAQRLWDSLLEQTPNVNMYTMEEVQQVTKKCVSCEIANAQLKQPPSQSTTQITAELTTAHTLTPFNHTILQDLAQWPVAGIGGVQYVSVIVDKGTRFLDVLALQSKDQAVKHALRWCGMFGYPSVLHTDNGREFCNKQYAELCTSRSIHHSTGAPQAPKEE
eukprot:GHVR01005401.1.p1 GENE.GHVR01005401.1~~GHVR01005401.1.p1  ORF type:complete len:269 (+),score=38.00 GHVR01005401.1:447-1253(+)